MPLYSVHSGSPDQLYIFSESTVDGGIAVADRTVNMPTGLTNPEGIAYYNGELAVTDDSGNEAFTFAESTADGTTPIPTRRIIFPSGLTTPNGIAWNAQGLWILDDSGDEVFLLPLSNASQTTDANGTITVTLTDSDIIKRFDLASLNIVSESLTIIGTQLVVGDRLEDALYFYDLSTANDTTAVIRRVVNLPLVIGDPYGIAAADSESVYITDLSLEELYQFPISKANETTHADGYTVVDLLNSDITLQFTLPSGLTNPKKFSIQI